MSLNIIFTWWNKQTFGTFLKTLFYGKYVGKDEFKNKYYKSKKDENSVVNDFELRNRILKSDEDPFCISRSCELMMRRNDG